MNRVKLISKLIEINEVLFFYPKLKKFYREEININNPTIIDIGVNKGQTIDFFLSIKKKSIVYGFEPNGSLFLFLKNKYKDNKNIVLYNKGISNISGKLELSESILDETSTLEELNFESPYLKKKARVLGVAPSALIKKKYLIEVITLSEFLNKNNFGHIEVLKIDTEGHEYKCLEGLFHKKDLSSIKFIQLEQHHNDMHKNNVDFKDIQKLLENNNFSLYKKIKHGFGDFEEVIFKNNNL